MIARPTSSLVPTFGRSAPTDRRASVRCVRARSTAVSMLRDDGRRHRTRLALRALQLHEDGGESLREIVVNVAREAVALLEDRLAPLFDTLLLDESAVMQRECSLPGDGLDQGDAPPLTFVAVARLARAERDPSQVLVADHERRHQRRAEPLLTDEVAHAGRHPLVIGAVFNRLMPARLIRKEMTRKGLARELRRLPLGTVGGEHLAFQVHHPDIAALLVLVDQPDADLVAFAFFGERLAGARGRSRRCPARGRADRPRTSRRRSESSPGTRRVGAQSSRVSAPHAASPRLAASREERAASDATPQPTGSVTSAPLGDSIWCSISSFP